MTDEILVEVFAEEGPAERDRMAQELRRELLEIREVDGVVPAVAGPAPPGTKAVGLMAIGALVVELTPTVEVLRKLLGTALGWLSRRADAEAPKAMRVTINGHTMEFTPDEEQQAEVVRAFIEAATAGPAGATPAS